MTRFSNFPINQKKQPIYAHKTEAQLKLILVVAVSVLFLLRMFVGPSMAWQQILSGSELQSDDQANDVVVDQIGDIYVVGCMEKVNVGKEFIVIKLDCNTGNIIWQARMSGTHDHGENKANTLALDNLGNVIAAGFLNNSGRGKSFAIVKINSSDGRILWKSTVDGIPTERDDSAYSVVIDGENNIIACGYLANDKPGSDFAVIKINGKTGEPAWKKNLNGPSMKNNFASDVVLDRQDHVIAVGRMGNTYSGSWITVVKLDKGSGSVIWKKNYFWGNVAGKGRANTVSLDREQNILLAGTLPYAGKQESFLVLKVRGNDGAEIWRKNFFGSAIAGSNYADALTTDADGNAFAAGVTVDLSGNRFAVIKLSGNDGTKLWPQGLKTSSYPYSASFATSLALDRDNNLISGGQILHENIHFAFALLKFDGKTGQIVWKRALTGTKTFGAFSLLTAVAVDRFGNPTAVGYLTNKNTGKDLIVIKVNGHDGSDFQAKTLRPNNVESEDRYVPVIDDLQ